MSHHPPREHGVKVEGERKEQETQRKAEEARAGVSVSESYGLTGRGNDP